MIKSEDKLFEDKFRLQYQYVSLEKQNFAMVCDENTEVFLKRIYLIDSEKRDIIQLTENDINFNLFQDCLKAIKISQKEEEYFKNFEKSKYHYFKNFNEWQEFNSRFQRYLIDDAYDEYYKNSVK